MTAKASVDGTSQRCTGDGYSPPPPGPLCVRVPRISLSSLSRGRVSPGSGPAKRPGRCHLKSHLPRAYFHIRPRRWVSGSRAWKDLLGDRYSPHRETLIGMAKVALYLRGLLPKNASPKSNRARDSGRVATEGHSANTWPGLRAAKVVRRGQSPGNCHTQVMLMDTSRPGRGVSRTGSWSRERTLGNKQGTLRKAGRAADSVDTAQGAGAPSPSGRCLTTIRRQPRAQRAPRQLTRHAPERRKHSS